MGGWEGASEPWDWLAIQGGGRRSQPVTQYCPALKARKHGYSQPKEQNVLMLGLGGTRLHCCVGVALCRSGDKEAPEESVCVTRGVCRTAGR